MNVACHQAISQSKCWLPTQPTPAWCALKGIEDGDKQETVLDS